MCNDATLTTTSSPCSAAVQILGRQVRKEGSRGGGDGAQESRAQVIWEDRSAIRRTLTELRCFLFRFPPATELIRDSILGRLFCPLALELLGAPPVMLCVPCMGKGS